MRTIPFHSVGLLFSIALLAGLGWRGAAPARAEPLDRNRLPADAHWFVYLDADAARASKAGVGLRDLLLEQPGVKGALERFQRATGTNPLTGIHSIMIYNTSFEPGVGVIVARADLEPRRLQRIVERLPDHASVVHGAYTIESWTDENSHHKTFGAIRQNDTVVMGPSEQAVAAELDQLDGKGRSLSAEQLAPTDETALVQIGVFGLATAKDLPFESPIARQCVEAHLVASERDGRDRIEATLVTRSPEIAQQVRSLVDGARALVLLQKPPGSAIVRLLNPMKATSAGATVNIHWEIPADELVKAVGRIVKGE